MKKMIGLKIVGQIVWTWVSLPGIGIHLKQLEDGKKQ